MKKNTATGIVNPEDIKKLAGSDKVIAQVYKKYGAPPSWSRPQGFVSLSKIILEQQVSLASAQAHFTRLNDYIGEFSPANILRLTDEEMRACHISRQKAKYLRELSNVINGKKTYFEELPGYGEEKIREMLTSIKGIGHWTTDIYLMFCLQAKNIFPAGDIAVVNTVKELYGAATREDITAVAERWAPLRSLGTYFMWHHYLEKRKR